MHRRWRSPRRGESGRHEYHAFPLTVQEVPGMSFFAALHPRSRRRRRRRPGRPGDGPRRGGEFRRGDPVLRRRTPPPAGVLRPLAPQGERLPGPRGRPRGARVLRRGDKAPARDLRALDAEGERPQGPGQLPGGGRVLRRGARGPPGQSRRRQKPRGGDPRRCAGR